MNDSSVGIFDSGIGGLTVFKEIAGFLPAENLIYLGDVARVPYGGRSKEAITKFALEMVDFLIKKQVKALVVACNTISANCLDDLRKFSAVPVLDVISPTIETAVQTTKNLEIAIVGTRSTIGSKVYEKSIKALNPKIHTISIACPLFVPFVEEGQTTGDAIESVARQYLTGIGNADTLILGCTHYPVLNEAITKTIGPNVQIISSGLPTAQKLKRFLTDNALLNGQKTGKHSLNVTDIGPNTENLVRNILKGQKEVKLEKVSLND